MSQCARIRCAAGRDDIGMDDAISHEGGSGVDAARRASLRDVQARLQEMLDGKARREARPEMPPAQPVPINISAYLLDPPPSQADQAGRERRRVLVRRWSIGVSFAIALVLVLPMPGAQEPNPAKEPASSTESLRTASAETAAAEPTGAPAAPAAVRVDRPTPTPRRVTRRATRKPRG